MNQSITAAATCTISARTILLFARLAKQRSAFAADCPASLLEKEDIWTIIDYWLESGNTLS